MNAGKLTGPLRAYHTGAEKVRFSLPVLLLLANLTAPPNLVQSNLTGFAIQNPKPERIEPDIPQEREIASGGSHSYLISLAPSQYVRGVVDQSSVDVSLELLNPDGASLIETDRVPRRSGAEELFYVAAVAGDYVLRVRVAGKSPGGHYAIRVESRAATARDQNIAAGFRIFNEAYRLGSDFTADASNKSIAKYEEALVFWRAAKDSPWEAETLGLIGIRYSWLSDYEHALESFKGALKAAETAGDPPRQAVALNNIASVLDDLGDKQEAAASYGRAASFFHASGDQRREGTALSNLGLLYSTIGKPHEAMEQFQKALDLSRSAGDRGSEAVTLHNKGGLYDTLGDRTQAISRYYSKSLEIFRILGDRGREAIVLTSIGHAQSELDEPDKALESYTRALELHRAGGNRALVAVTLNNIASVYRARGDKLKAIEYLEQALTIRRTVGDRAGEAITLNNLGMMYDSPGNLEKAIEYLEKALVVQRPDSTDAAGTFFNLAKVHLARGDLEVASDNIDRAISMRESVRANIHHRQLRTSYFAGLRDYYQVKIDVLMRLDLDRPDRGYNVEAFATSEKARARTLLEMVYQSGGEVGVKADPALLDQRKQLHRQLDREAMAQQRLIDRKQPAEEIAASSKQIDALIDTLEEVEGRIKYADASYSALVQATPLNLDEIRRWAIGSDTLLLEYALGERESYLWALTRGGLTTYRLPPRRVIEDLARRVYTLLTAPSRQPAAESIRARSARLGEAEMEYHGAAAQLSEILLGPVGPQLSGRALLVVSDGALQYVSFAALPLPSSNRGANKGVPVLAEHEVVSIPSASILATLRKQRLGRKPAPKMVAVLADPVFSADDWRVRRDHRNQPAPELNLSDVRRSAADSGALDPSSQLPRLPLTRVEAEVISRLVPPGQYHQALDFAATREAATDPALADYRIIHFATHGLLNSAHPELSGLVFSLVDQSGRPQQGFLRLHEIYNMNLPAEIVVLSACQTAMGKEIKGEGLMALTRGFMHAGAARVLASLWKIDDRATAIVMSRFYQGMLGSKRMRPAAALRDAQLEMWKSTRWRSAYYWGAYVLQGDWS